MRLLNFTARRPLEPGRIETDRVLMRRPQSTDFHAWADLRRNSAGFLRPFEPKWTDDELTRAAYRSRMRRQDSDIVSGKGLPWFLFEKQNEDVLLGGLSISNIRRGVAETGTLGYWMGENHSGKGFMREAVLAVCAELFSTHNLHRIEAATVLDNPRSRRLLESCGFQEEGIARSYLKINGEWRDHVLFALIAEDLGDK